MAGHLKSMREFARPVARAIVREDPVDGDAVVAADPGNSPLSITETPQLIAGAGRS
jgi:hypothetical protein